MGRHVAHIGRTAMYIGFSWEIQKERDHLEDLYIAGRIMLGRILQK
jgi:hypothetical protein